MQSRFKLNHLFAIIPCIILLLVFSTVVAAEETTSDAPPSAETPTLESPTVAPTEVPEVEPTQIPTETPAFEPTSIPTEITTETPTEAATEETSIEVTAEMTVEPSPTADSMLPTATETLTAVSESFGAEPELALFTSDNFDGGDLSAYIGGGDWALVDSEGGKALQITNQAALLQLTQGNLLDVAAQARFQLSDGRAQIRLRQSSATAYYRATLDVNGQVNLYRGADTLLQLAITAPAAPGQWRVLRLSAIDDVLRVTVDGVQVLAVRDNTPLPPGFVIIGGETMSAMLMDDFGVWLTHAEMNSQETATATPEISEAVPTTTPQILATSAITFDNLRRISPDSQQVVYLTASNLGMQDSIIWVSRADGSDSQPLVVGSDESWVTNPIWSPDGQYIAYMRVSYEAENQFAVGNSYQLWMVNIDGTNNILLTNQINPSVGYGGQTDISWNDMGEIEFDNNTLFPAKRYALNPFTGAMREIDTQVNAASSQDDPLHDSLAQPVNVPYFSQGDSRWAGNRLGTCTSTIHSHGCVITSMSMIFKYFGADIDPGRFNTWLTNNGGYASGCLYYWAVGANYDQRIKYIGNFAFDTNRLNSELDAGYPVGVWVNNGGHFVVVTHRVGSTYYIHDPSHSKTTLSQWTGIGSMQIYHGPLPVLTPTAPSNLAVSAISQSQINLSWKDNSNNESGFRIYRNGTLIATLPANTTTYQNTGLTCGTSYTYQVAAYNSSGESTKSNAASAITFSCFPAPVRTAPANGSTLTNSRPPLRWNAVNGATAYRLRVDNDSNFSSPVIDRELTGRSFTPPASLGQGTYYWCVMAKNAANQWSSCSSPNWTFNINILRSPVNGATTRGTPCTVRPTFRWASVPGAAGYTIQAATNNTFTAGLVSWNAGRGAANSRIPTGLSGGTYYWRVNVTNIPSVSNVNRQVLVRPARPPATGLTSPANGAILPGSTPTLTWRASNYACTTARYEVQVDNNSNFSSLNFTAANLSAPSVTVLPSLTNGTYYWRVRVVNSFGEAGSWSEVRRFRVNYAPPPVPPTPALTSPANNAATSSNNADISWYGITLRWNPVSYQEAVTYQIQVDNQSTFASPEYTTTNLTGTARTIPFRLGNSIYYWRVRAVSASGAVGAWSSARTFRVNGRLFWDRTVMECVQPGEQDSWYFEVYNNTRNVWFEVTTVSGNLSLNLNPGNGVYQPLPAGQGYHITATPQNGTSGCYALTIHNNNGEGAVPVDYRLYWGQARAVCTSASDYNAFEFEVHNSGRNIWFDIVVTSGSPALPISQYNHWYANRTPGQKYHVVLWPTNGQSGCYTITIRSDNQS